MIHIIDMGMFTRFSLVGIINTLVSTLTYWIALKVGVSPDISYFVSFLLGTISFIWFNTRWTFDTTRQFGIIWIRGIVLNVGLALMGSLSIPLIIKLGIPVQVAQLVLVPLTWSIKYGISKSWVFVSTKGVV